MGGLLGDLDDVADRSDTQQGSDGPAVESGAGGVAAAVRADDPELKASETAAEQGGPAQGGQFAGRSAWLLVVCCVAQFMVILDLSIVNVALPSIQSTLSFSQAQLQWVVDAYAITFAGFLMLGGRAADHFGQRRTFVVALILFALASLVGGLSANREMLIIARAGQGLSGALMAAASLAIITSSFPQGPQLHRAIGMWGAMNGLGGAAGTLLGGVITQELTWRWVLLINPPIGIAAAAIAWSVVKDRRRERGAPGFDLPGALTLTVGQMVLVYGIVEAGIFSWHATQALIPIIAGVAVLALFGLIESRLVSSPLVPFKEITKPLAVANGIVLLFSAALFPMWFVGSLYLQQVLGLSPLHTGLAFLPMALMIMVCARSAGKLVSRFGVRAVLGGGLLMMTGGMLLFTRIQPSGSPIAYIVIPGLLTAAGIGFSIVPSTIAATQGAKQGQTGLASGLVNTSRQVGGGLGLALLITLATEYTTHLIGHNRGIEDALTHGFQLAYLIGAGLVAAAALLTFLVLPRPGAAARRAGPRPLPLVAGVAAMLAVFFAIDFAAAGSHGAPIGRYVTTDSYRFVSEPDLHPPVLKADVPTVAGKLAPGYIFTTNFYDITSPPMYGQSGPLILNNRLQPVWFKPVPTDVIASNLSTQRYHGKPVLAWWQGVISSTGATEKGEDVIVDQHYRTIATIKAAGDWLVTVHELLIHGNDLWVTANRNLPMNLSKYGGAYNGALIDSAVQEYDIRTGKLIYNWDALQHIPLSASYASLPTNGFPWDAYHVNAINLLGDGTFVVSMRNDWAAYKVDIRTGRVIWTLGGKHSDFKLGPGAGFQWQHDVVVYPHSPLITMFDDHCCQITGGGTYVSPTGPSRGLLLKLNTATHTATLLGQYSRGSGFDADYMGSMQPQRNGDELVGWGSEPYISEYSTSGQLLLDAVFPGPDISYRAYRAAWVGLPLTPPAAAARRTGTGTTVYASWNGATRVASWRVLSGSSVVGRAVKSGFETVIPVSAGTQSFRVQALDSRGRVIGASPAFGITH